MNPGNPPNVDITEQLRNACGPNGVIGAAISSAVHAQAMVERAHSYNMIHVHPFNREIDGVLLVLPIIEVGDRRGDTPTREELGLPAVVDTPMITKTTLHNLSEEEIRTIHSVYNDPSLDHTVVASLTIRRKNLVLFFFGLGGAR